MWPDDVARRSKRATNTVPRPGVVAISTECAIRAIAPIPMPNVPAVELRSRRAALMSAMPGPESTATTSISAVSAARTARSSTAPPPPWRWTLEAISVTARPISATRTSGAPNCVANCSTARRAPPTALGSSSRTHATSSTAGPLSAST